jgi:hypothetical protein
MQNCKDHIWKIRVLRRNTVFHSSLQKCRSPIGAARGVMGPLGTMGRVRVGGREQRLGV